MINVLKAFECGEHRRFHLRRGWELVSSAFLDTTGNCFSAFRVNKSGGSPRTQKPAAKDFSL